ncbi:MAG: ABC transporter ATP-binding protein [Bacilli bacterium]|jgi:ATP-binding cassette subfamily B protein|nr:ABC transporter ATP-binding protein [Acholeplasmataceae bacterium]
MSKKIRKRPDLYASEAVLSRVFKYAMKSKVIIILSSLFLIGFTVMELIQPMLVSTILDEHLLGIQTTYVNVSEENDKTVVYDDNHYLKVKDYEQEINDDLTFITVVYFDNNYHVVFGQVESNQIEIIEEGVAYLEDGTTFVSAQLSKEEVELFFKHSPKAIINILIWYAVLTILIMVLRYGHNIMFTDASMRLTLDMRKNAYEKLNRLPISYFSEEPSGKIVTKINSDSEGVRGLYQVIFSIGSAIVSLLLVYGGLFIADWKLALLTLVILPIIILWMTVYRRINNRYHHKIREMNSIINAHLAQYVSGVSIIQVFNKEQKMTQEYDDLLIKNYKNKIKRQRIDSLFGSELLNLLQRLLTALVIFYFGRKYLSGSAAVSAGTIYLYITYLGRVINPLMSIFSNLNQLEDSFVASSRIFEFLDTDEDKFIGYGAIPRFNGKVEFKDVSFSYDDENKVLKNVNIAVNPGEFIGLVGHTGSGKSTMMSLLVRFYDLKEGQILIDDVDFMTYTKQEVRSHIGYILQDPALFEGTIKYNIAFEEEVDDQVIIDILRQIGADKFIDVFPEGIHSKVEYLGNNLSTGEKQLIAFARMLLKNPSILILDEATANIDSETEQLIQKALSVLAEGRTTFVVAHRLSTIKDADRIYVLDDGRVVEQGTHSELYAMNGKYRKMYDAQYHK